MARPVFLFTLLIALCLLTGSLFFIEERPYRDGDAGRVHEGHGIAHPNHETMLAGGDGIARHSHLLWLGWAMVSLTVVFAVGCLALGVTRGGSTGPLSRPLRAGAILFVLIFTALFVTYHGYMSGGSQTLFIGLPAPTAWLAYAVWAFPLVFALFFLLNFERWYVRAGDLERLHSLAAQNARAREERG